jgi:hypothetical protein
VHARNVSKAQHCGHQLIDASRIARVSLWNEQRRAQQAAKPPAAAAPTLLLATAVGVHGVACVAWAYDPQPKGSSHPEHHSYRFHLTVVMVMCTAALPACPQHTLDSCREPCKEWVDPKALRATSARPHTVVNSCLMYEEVQGSLSGTSSAKLHLAKAITCSSTASATSGSNNSRNLNAWGCVFSLGR